MTWIRKQNADTNWSGPTEHEYMHISATDRKQMLYKAVLSLTVEQMVSKSEVPYTTNECILNALEFFFLSHLQQTKNYKRFGWNTRTDNLSMPLFLTEYVAIDPRVCSCLSVRPSVRGSVLALNMLIFMFSGSSSVKVEFFSPVGQTSSEEKKGKAYLPTLIFQHVRGTTLFFFFGLNLQYMWWLKKYLQYWLKINMFICEMWMTDFLEEKSNMQKKIDLWENTNFHVQDFRKCLQFAWVLYEWLDVIVLF